jgi:hypothetical protein
MKFTLQVVVLLMALIFPPRAQEIEHGGSIVCATQAQVERLATILDQNTKTAISIVNAEEHDPSACFTATVAFVRGGQIGIARNTSGTFKIVEILVVGIDTGSGFRSVVPAIYHSLRSTSVSPDQAQQWRIR